MPEPARDRAENDAALDRRFGLRVGDVTNWAPVLGEIALALDGLERRVAALEDRPRRPGGDADATP